MVKSTCGTCVTFDKIDHGRMGDTLLRRNNQQQDVTRKIQNKKNDSIIVSASTASVLFVKERHIFYPFIVIRNDVERP